MSFIIENSSFYKISKIVVVKTHVKRLGAYEVINNVLKGKIYVDIDYFDSDETENFTTANFDFFVSIPQDVTINEIVLKDLKLEVVEAQGVNANYELEIVTILDKSKEIDVIIEKNITPVVNEPIDITDIKVDEEELGKKIEVEFKKKSIVEEIKISEVKNQEIKQDLITKYDELLEKSLESREVEKESKKSNNIEVVETRSSQSPLDFISFFNNLETKYYKVKSIYVESEEHLQSISQTYNVSIETLYKSYDKEKKVVVIKCQN